MVNEVLPGSRAALRPCLDRAIDQGRLSAQVYSGPWVDVGTPQRLAELNTDEGDRQPSGN
jgi:MurNAc alpha-1-phosphate uridylyltransferase